MPINGDRLKQRRKALGYTQEEVAAMAGVKQSIISDLERGSEGNPTSTSLIGIADALQTSTDWLLGRTDDPTPPLRDEQSMTWKDRKIIAHLHAGEKEQAIRLILTEQ